MIVFLRGLSGFLPESAQGRPIKCIRVPLGGGESQEILALAV
jgi:hypothetical protein